MTNHHLLAALGLVTLAGCAGPSLSGQSSRLVMFRGGPDHPGAYSDPTGPELVGLQWRFDTEGGVVSTPAVSGDTVWFGSGDGRLYAVDLVTGAARWATDLGSPVSSSPAVTGNRVIVGTIDGRFHSVHSTTGAIQWQVGTGAELPLPWGHESGDVWTSSAAIVNDLAIVGAGDGFVHALEVASGKTRWRAQTGGRIRATPAVANGTVFAGAIDGVFYAFDLATGSPKWRYQTLGATLESGKFGYDRRTIQSSAAVSGNTVVFGARDGIMYALSADSGALRWKMDHEISWVNGSPAIAEGVVYVGSSDAHFVQAVALDTGRELWRTPVGSSVWSSAAVTPNLVLSTDGAGRVRALDRGTGAIRWTFYTGGQVHSSPVPAGDLVLVGSADGGLYALRTGATPTHRAVYIDTTGKLKAAPTEVATAQALVDRGYPALGSAELVRFLEARVADRAPSVVVFAMDHLPPEAAAEPLGQSLLRRYLDAGGKVLWRGMSPLIFPRDPVTGQRPPGGLGGFRWDAGGSLLGVDLGRGIFDPRMIRPTAAGRAWGLSQRWREGWSVDPKGVTEVLALDDWGLAGAWVKSYGGPRGTGFVRAPGEDHRALYCLAEFRPRGA